MTGSFANRPSPFRATCTFAALAVLAAGRAPAEQVASQDAQAARAAIQPHADSDPVHLPMVDADDLRFVHLATAQGLSQTRAQQIIQDNDGFIWFGTQYGLNRYDGYKFKVFTHDPRV